MAKKTSKKAGVEVGKKRIVVQCPLHDSFRVAAVAGMFDVELQPQCVTQIDYSVPPLDKDWKVGLIVGPSGSGKSTVAKELFSDTLFSGYDWDPQKSVIDNFPEDMSVKEVISLLTTVGFSSPPSWIKPWQVLSNGEKFRCDMAIALAQPNNMVVFDEFTSVVDRTVAKVASAALATSIRSGRIDKKFVAIACHYDIEEWLEPDWILDMRDGSMSDGRCLRRPEIKIEICKTGRKFWPLFEPHHYMKGAVPVGAQYWTAFYEGQPVGIVLVANTLQRQDNKRISRIVVLPDYQGIRIGGALLDTVAEYYHSQNCNVFIKTLHPSMIGRLKRSTKWIVREVKKEGYKQYHHKKDGANTWCRNSRPAISFKYIGDKTNGKEQSGSEGTPSRGSSNRISKTVPRKRKKSLRRKR